MQNWALMDGPTKLQVKIEEKIAVQSFALESVAAACTALAHAAVGEAKAACSPLDWDDGMQLDW